jgi:NAD(P)-dependent dehydrogenase (short-subunit alcohol dehydrogenase family)
MSDLHGRAAVVTGAAQGLGRAVARAYVAAGMRVALMDVKAEALRQAAEELGASAVPIVVDLADGPATQRAAQAALELVGTPRVLVHNAAVLINRPLMQITLEDWTREVNVILQAAFLLTQAVWQPMIAAGGGSLIYVSSRSGIEGFLDEAPYVAGKHALEGFMKCMALEGAPHRIAAVTVTPGRPMRTPMSEANYPDELKQQWIDPYLLTPAFLRLAGAEALALSGQRLNAWELSEAER